MRQIVIVAAPLAALCVLVATAVLVRRVARHRAAAAGLVRPEPQSVVHVLTTDSELREAVERATRFERGVAELLESRAARYESLLRASPTHELRTVPQRDTGVARSRTDGAPQPRLA